MKVILGAVVFRRRLNSEHGIDEPYTSVPRLLFTQYLARIQCLKICGILSSPLPGSAVPSPNGDWE